MKVVTSTILALGLAACGGPQIVPFEPEPPRPALMKAPPATPPAIQEGADLYDDNATLRGELGRSYSQVRGLQGYIRTLLKRARQKAEAKK